MEIRRANRLCALLIALALSVGTAFAGGEQESADGQEAGGADQAGEQQASGAEQSDGAAEAAASEQLYGTIEYLEGQVAVNGEPAQIGGEVESGDRITTGRNGLAEIVFDDRNLFRLRPQTTLTLTFDENQIRQADLEEGTFAAVFDKLRQVGQGQDSFRIRTPTAVGGVRGTTFFVQVEEPSSTYFCTCHGETHLSPFESNESYSVSATHHTAYRFVQTEEGVERQQSSMIYHNDAVMEEIAGKIDVTIPWGE
jgi:hypothetical protein